MLWVVGEQQLEPAVVDIGICFAEVAVGWKWRLAPVFHADHCYGVAALPQEYVFVEQQCPVKAVALYAYETVEVGFFVGS